MRKTHLLTDTDLRVHWSGVDGSTYSVFQDAIITPAAQDFIREHRIQLHYRSFDDEQDGRPEALKPDGTIQKGESAARGNVMHRTPIPFRNGKAVFIDAATGEMMESKPEEMTHLRGNILVPKTHPQIAFRGKLDTLMAQTMWVQVLAAKENASGVVRDLGDILAFTREILGAEVKNMPLAEICVMGMSSSEIRSSSHDVKKVFGIDHPIPDYSMGELAIALNLLRTQIRETELSAARAFTDKDNVCTRKDIVEGLNRLSSCVYIIFCRILSGFYEKDREEESN
jgi:ethanolamine utilization cobalamin adenosyltransferase